MSGAARWLWVRCLMDERLHLLDPRAVREATAVGCATAHCGRLILEANLTLHGDSVGMCVGCVAVGSTPSAHLAPPDPARDSTNSVSVIPRAGHGSQPLLSRELRSTVPKSAIASLSSGSGTTILARCAPHRGPRVFAPLLVQAREGEVVLEAQVTGGCQVILDEAGVSVLFDLLGAWLTGAQVG